MAPRRAQNTTRQGAVFELQIMEHLRGLGYTVLRSSGSHGAVDVVAVGEPHTLWIQAKITNPIIPPAEREAVVAIAREAKGVPVVAYRLEGRVCFRELTGTGPREFVVFRPWMHPRAVCHTCKHQHRMHARGTGCWAQDAKCGCEGFTTLGEARKAERSVKEKERRAAIRRKKEEL